MKRLASTRAGPLSPPPTKRRIESTTTNKAVASFFKPASQKEKDSENLTWRIINQSLIIGSFTPTPRIPLTHPVKIAAFDLDDTVITPIAQGQRWNRSATSWKFWDACVPGRLKDLYNQGYLVVLLSNQSTISLKDDAKKKVGAPKDSLSLGNFKSQVSAVLGQLDFPMSVYAATGHDRYRKPRVGMWEEMIEDYDLEGEGVVDKAASFYVGDAAGREKTDVRKKDHATSDRDLAANIGIRFQTPEEFFLGAETEPYTHGFEPGDYLARMVGVQSKAVDFVKRSEQELVIFCGSPGAGKSSFYWNKLEPLGYERVNQDILKTRDRCIKVAREHLMRGKSVVVGKRFTATTEKLFDLTTEDNTNADAEVRALWIKLAKEFHLPIRCIRFTASTRLCEHNDNVRALNKQLNRENRTQLPGIAFRSFAQRFVEPEHEEGFQDITKVEFTFEGTPQERELWSKYWVSKFST